MIYLEVIKSNDPLALGLYEYEFDKVTIGRSKKSDLIFNDLQLPLQFLSLKFVQGQLVVQSATRSPFFFVNGKKVSGTLKLKKDDVIAFGDNKIRITNSGVSNESADFTSAYEEFNHKAPELKFALEFIEQILMDLEKDQNV